MQVSLFVLVSGCQNHSPAQFMTFTHESSSSCIMSSNQDQATHATGILVLFNGLPIVTENQWPLLARFLLRNLRNNEPLNYNKICMPVDGQGTTFG